MKKLLSIIIILATGMAFAFSASAITIDTAKMIAASATASTQTLCTNVLVVGWLVSNGASDSSTSDTYYILNGFHGETQVWTGNAPMSIGVAVAQAAASGLVLGPLESVVILPVPVPFTCFSVKLGRDSIRFTLLTK